MKFGVYLNPQTVASESDTTLRDGMLDLARAVDYLGFHHISAGQHFLSGFKQIQLIPYLARLTGEVPNVETFH